MAKSERPDFNKLANTPRSFQDADRKILGPITTIAITPVADGRVGAHEDNVERTWRMVEKVYDLITSNVLLPDGKPVRRSGASFRPCMRRRPSATPRRDGRSG
mgnify:CR=1 FL=1